jgi:hypothetical protein
MIVYDREVRDEREVESQSIGLRGVRLGGEKSTMPIGGRYTCQGLPPFSTSAIIPS